MENVNVRAAIIHMIGDIVQSTGVVVAAIIIYLKPTWHLADPICTFTFTFLTLLTTLPIFRDCCRILMEATPADLDVEAVFKDVLSMEEVEEVHDFHVWTLSEGKISMSGHIRSS